jgi:hexosaminidase
LPATIEQGNHTVNMLRLPSITIFDYPSYSWRGMHIDVARHFFSIAYLRKFINVMALYKMNKLHIHLTDDQGWRIEIKKYPLLTAQGAWRKLNGQDSVCIERAKTDPDFKIDSTHLFNRNGELEYGGYYTQQEMREFVAYAKTKFIDVIPEVDMPGHMMAAIKAYPYLTANHGGKWGPTFSQPICPCLDSTYIFAENVFSEIMKIFPSQYVHIGGDEVDRTSWGETPACVQLMKRQGICTLPGLQSYFINHMEKYFNDHGKKLIGWDEILDGGISSTALIMYWRTWVPNAPVVAAKNGNSVIMTPGTPLYFDHPADKNSIFDVYHFNPIPTGLNAEQAEHIIGAQANIWSEYIPSEKRADFMYMPRMTALAELLWSNRQSLYTSYQKRLIQQYARLDALHLNYRMPDIPGLEDNRVFINADTLRAGKLPKQFFIRFTTNGILPNNNSPLLTIYPVTETSQIKLAVFNSAGRRGEVFTIHYERQKLAPSDSLENLVPELQVDYYKGHYEGTEKISNNLADSSFTVSNITIPSSVNASAFGLKYGGFITVPEDGIYTFQLTCDDGGVLWISGRQTVNNDGMHPAIEKLGQVALNKGQHKFALHFIEAGGGFSLKLKYSLNGSSFQNIPDAWFSHIKSNSSSSSKE